MAQAADKEVKVQIINIEQDPRASGRQIISCKIDDGSKEGPWIQAFSIIPPDVALTLEQFVESILDRIKRPDDVFHNLKAAQASGTVLAVNLTDNINHPGA